MPPSDKLSALTPTRLFYGLLRPVPDPIATQICQYCIARFERLYPSVFSRLDPLHGQTLLIDPDDLLFSFLFSFTHQGLKVKAMKQKPIKPPDASIKGTLGNLLQLAEGKVDGDALFFTRQLQIEGDMELILTVRNALEGEDVSFEEVFIGPLIQRFPNAKHVINRLKSFNKALSDDLQGVETSIKEPLWEHIEQIEAELNHVSDQISLLQKRIKKPRHESQ